MRIEDRNICERANWSEFYGSALNPNEEPARKALYVLLPLATLLALLLVASAVFGLIKVSSLFIVAALTLFFFAAARG